MNPGESISRSCMMICFGAAALILWIQREPPRSPLKPAITTLEQPAAQPRQPGFDPQFDPQLSRFTSAPAATSQSLLKVSLRERTVSLYENGQLQTQYPIAVGQKGWETPTGTFKVIQMQSNPVWKHPLTGEIVPAGRENPLGSHWIGFWSDGRDQIGFHGTNQEELIGQAVSHGCIRMRNQDIARLYAKVNPGTPVIVQP